MVLYNILHRMRGDKSRLEELTILRKNWKESGGQTQDSEEQNLPTNTADTKVGKIRQEELRAGKQLNPLPH